MRRHRPRTLAGPARFRAGAACAAVAVMLWSLGGSASAADSLSPSGTGSGSWTVYHGNPAGTGVAAAVTSVDTAAPAWTSAALDGQLYGEPLVYAGRVYVATENDTVYALSAATGQVAWSVHLGSPVPAGSLPCGDIGPVAGVTGTPVIDPARNEIFVVADETAGGGPAHRLFGLSTVSGRIELSQDVDPPGADPAALLQRTGLALDAGQVVFGMGGNYGDCAAYRGRVVAVPEAGGTPEVFTVDAASGESEGAVWMGGAAPVIDSRGDIWVSTGNGSVTSYQHPYDDSDSVLELTPSMRLLQYFAPSTWATNNSQDLDLSVAPALLPDGQVVVAGKSRIVYLLNGTSLGGIGHEQVTLGASESSTTGSACGDDIDGGVAVTGMTVYLPCRAGIIAVRATQSPPGLRLLWSSGAGGGPPVVAAGLVWTISQNGTLYGLDPATGKVRQQAEVGAPANHFPTPAVADGLLLATSSDQVVAFAAAGQGPRAGVTPPASTAPASTGPLPSKSNSGVFPATGVIALVVLAVIIGVAMLARRRAGRR